MIFKVPRSRSPLNSQILNFKFRLAVFRKFVGCDAKYASSPPDRGCLPKHGALSSHVVALAAGSINYQSSNLSRPA
jgi:hypothetical protein